MRPAVRLFALASMILATGCPVCEAAGASETTMDALEVMADLTLIDGACQAVVVNFGAGFRFAATHGVPALSMLPGGRRRAEFEAVLRTRQASFGAEELCSQIVKNYVDALPGSMTSVYRRVDSSREAPGGERAYEPVNR